MSRDLYVSLLRQGNTGNEILSILESFVDGSDDSVGAEDGAGPTLNPIAFWWSLRGARMLPFLYIIRA